MSLPPPHDTLKRSAALFGNRHLAKVVATVAALVREHDMVTTRRIATRLNVADSNVRAVMLRLVEGGVIEPVPRKGGARSEQFYEIADNEVARIYVAAAEVVAGATTADALAT